MLKSLLVSISDSDTSDAPPIRIRFRQGETVLLRDVLSEIFSYLTFDDVIGAVASVCKVWWQLAHVCQHKLVISRHWNPKRLKRLQNFILKRGISFKEIVSKNPDISSSSLGLICSISQNRLESLFVEGPLLVDDVKELANCRYLETLKVLNMQMDQTSLARTQFIAALKNIPNLTNLVLKCYLMKETRITFENILGITHLTNLEIANIKLCELVPVLSQSKLVSLKISKCELGAMNALDGLKSIKTLKSIEIEQMAMMDEELFSILEIPHLEKLSLSFLTGITNEPLKKIASVSLKSLEICVMKCLCDEAMLLYKSLKSIEFFKCDYANITDKSLVVLQELKSCRNMCLDGTLGITDEIFSNLPSSIDKLSLSHCSNIKLATKVTGDNLKSLNLYWNKKISSDALSNISSLYLESLNLGFCTNITEGIDHISKMTSLCKLNISHFPLKDEHLAALKQLVNIKELDIGATQITGKGFPVLPSLIDLNLNRCAELTSAGMEDVLQNTGIIRLQLMSSYKMTAKIKSFDRMCYLEYLQVRDCPNLPKDSFDFLSRCTKLRKLILIADSSLENECLRFLLPLGRLEFLDISQCEHLDDKSIKFLGKMTNLKRLNIQRCKIKKNVLQKHLVWTNIKK